MSYILLVLAIIALTALIDYGISYLVVKLVCMALGVTFNIIWVWVVFIVWVFILGSLRTTVKKN